jgi:hypothetical protein
VRFYPGMYVVLKEVSLSLYGVTMAARNDIEPIQHLGVQRYIQWLYDPRGYRHSRSFKLYFSLFTVENSYDFHKSAQETFTSLQLSVLKDD